MKKRGQNRLPQIHLGKQPRRPHHIQDWAEKRGLHEQADLAREIGADKSQVSRWYSGSTPGEEWQEKLAARLTDGDKEALFRSPEDDWIRRFFERRSQEEIDRAKQILEAAFPKKEAASR